MPSKSVRNKLANLCSNLWPLPMQRGVMMNLFSTRNSSPVTLSISQATWGTENWERGNFLAASESFPDSCSYSPPSSSSSSSLHPTHNLPIPSIRLAPNFVCLLLPPPPFAFGAQQIPDNSKFAAPEAHLLFPPPPLHSESIYYPVNSAQEADLRLNYARPVIRLIKRHLRRLSDGRLRTG